MNGLLFAGICALCWAGAPLIARFAGINVWLMAIMVSVGSAVALVPTMPFQNYSDLSFRSIAIGLGAGLINGIGLLAFYKLVDGAAQGQWEFSRLGAITYVLVPVLFALATVGMNAAGLTNEPMTTNKVVGLVLAGAAIWFLNQ